MPRPRAPGPGSASSPRRSPRARRSGSSDLKIPEPTNTPSAPSCMTSEASAGVAIPPAQNSTTGRRPSSATWRTSVQRRLKLLGGGRELGVVERRQPADLAADLAQVAHGLDDVAGAGLALGADHRRALADPAQRLAEVRRAAHERDLERPLVDVVGLVGGRQDLGLVDVVDLERLEHLGLGEVADPRLGHHGDRDRLLDALDHHRVGHPGDAAVAADVGGYALERHHRGGAGVLGDLRLLGGDHVHDHAALEHLGQAGLDGERCLVAWGLVSLIRSQCSGRYRVPPCPRQPATSRVRPGWRPIRRHRARARPVGPGRAARRRRGRAADAGVRAARRPRAGAGSRHLRVSAAGAARASWRSTRTSSGPESACSCSRAPIRAPDGIEVVRARALRVAARRSRRPRHGVGAARRGPRGGEPTDCARRTGRCSPPTRSRSGSCEGNFHGGGPATAWFRLQGPDRRRRGAVPARAPGGRRRLRQRHQLDPVVGRVHVHQPRPDPVRRPRAGRGVDRARVANVHRQSGRGHRRERPLRQDGRVGRATQALLIARR